MLKENVLEKFFCMLCVLLCAGVLFCASSLSAQTVYTWAPTGGSTDFLLNSNWQNGGGNTPFNGETASGPAEMRIPAGSGVLQAPESSNPVFSNIQLKIDEGKIFIGDAAAGVAGERNVYFRNGSSVILNGIQTLTPEQIADPSTVTSSLISSHYFNIGDSGSASMTINGGYVKCKHLRVGSGTSGAASTLNMNGGYLKTWGQAQIGEGAGNGTGIVNMNGGIWNANEIHLGYSEAGTGTIHLEEGRIEAVNSYIGKYAGAVGTLNIRGGVYQAVNFYVGHTAGAEGVLNLSGGNLNTTGTTVVGNGGNGTVNLSGVGVWTPSSVIQVGNAAGYVGTFNINGGTLASSSRIFMVGNAENAQGTVNFYSGNVSTGTLQVGTAVNSRGTVNVYGNTWDAHHFELGMAEGSSAVMNIYGGSVTTHADSAVGKSGNGAVLNVYAGAVLNATPVTGGNTSYFSVLVGDQTEEYGAGRGTVNLYGGTIQDNNFDVKNGTVNVYGGSQINSKYRIGLGLLTNSDSVMNVYGDTVLKAGGEFLLCAFQTKAAGILNLYDGNVSLSTGDFGIGWNNADGMKARLNVRGADVTVSANTIYMGYAFGGSTQINVSDGSLTFTRGTLIAGRDAFTGTPEITLSGGTMKFTSGTITGNTNACINFALGKNGFGALEYAGSFDGYKGKFYIGVNHGTSMISNYSAANGCILTAPQAVFDAGEKLTVSALLTAGDGHKYTLNPAMNANGGNSYALGSSPLEIADAYASQGWLSLAGMEDMPFDLTLGLKLNMTDGHGIADVVSWFNQNLDAAAEISAEDENSVILHYAPTFLPTFAWDFTQFDPTLGTIALASLQGEALPEPATWLLMLLALGFCFIHRNSGKK